MSRTEQGRQTVALEALGRRIASGDYPTGAPLPLEVIGKELGVSRPVIREALSVLTAIGMVRAWPKRGTFVQPRSQWDWLHPLILRWYHEAHEDFDFLDAVAQTRSIIEPQVARLAAARRSETDLAELAESLNQMATATWHPDTFIAADLRFHRVLLRASHNELLMQIDSVIETALRSHDGVVLSERRVHSLKVHRAVYEAVRRQSSDDAEKAMWQVLEKARSDLALIREAKALLPPTYVPQVDPTFARPAPRRSRDVHPCQ